MKCIINDTITIPVFNFSDEIKSTVEGNIPVMTLTGPYKEELQNELNIISQNKVPINRIILKDEFDNIIFEKNKLFYLVSIKRFISSLGRDFLEIIFRNDI